MLTNDVRMEKTMINDFTITQNENGKWLVTPKERPTYDKFQQIRKVMTAHGGKYLKGAAFAFDEEPTWLATTEIAEESKTPVISATATATSTKVVTPAKKVATPIKPPKKEEPKKSGVEFEIYPVETVEACAEYIATLKEKFKGCDDHMATLGLILEACANDEELRANITHKDYEEMLFQGAKAMAMGKKATATHLYVSVGEVPELVPYVIKEYKKPTVKKSAVETLLTSKIEKK